jgi:DNA-3-methyladenine glycosylase II
MWFEKPPRRPDWSPATKHLRRDPVMRKLIARVGPCTLAPRRDYFVVLCKSIFTQQISTKIAAILFARFAEQFPRKRATPQLVVKFLDPKKGDDELIRRCGISRQKRLYLLDLAKHFVRGEIPTKRFGQMSDDDIIESLTRVHGIGRWTAEMFLIFVLNRADVLPVDDLGLREATRKFYELSERPKAAELTALGESWRPWRTVATWYLWRGLSLEPSSVRAKPGAVTSARK